MYVCDSFNHRVQVFGLDGSFVRQWGGEGSGEGQFDGPYGVVVNGDEVLVTDLSNDRVQVFGLEGSFMRQWGGKRYQQSPEHLDAMLAPHEHLALAHCNAPRIMKLANSIPFTAPLPHERAFQTKHLHAVV